LLDKGFGEIYTHPLLFIIAPLTGVVFSVCVVIGAAPGKPAGPIAAESGSLGLI